MKNLSRHEISIKTDEELERMRLAGKIVSEVFQILEGFLVSGVTTERLNKIAEECIIEKGGVPAFKGYHGYPATICTSVNEEVVHGIPGGRALNNGDIVSIDVGVRFGGLYADAARTFKIGLVSDEVKRLVEIAKQALEDGIKKVVDGNRLGDVSWAIQQCVETAGFSVVRQYVGHGIGRELHEEPEIPNYGRPHLGVVLKKGMVLAIEPMVNMGNYAVELMADGWTVVTKDRSFSSHFEDTVVVGKDKAEVITR